MTPIIEVHSATEIKWTNPPIQTDPNGLNLSVRVSIFKDGSTTALRTEDVFTQSGGVIFTELATGSYTIKYKQGWAGTPDSETSNSVTLSSQVSATPTVTSFDSEVPLNGSANISITGVAGASLYSVRGSEQAQYLGIIGANGIKNYSYTQGGTYKYYQIETGKSQSAFTDSITITDPTMQSCDNGSNPFRIDSAIYDQNTSVLTFVFDASGLSEANYTVKGSNGGTVKQGFLQTTSSTVTINMPQLGNDTFTLEVIGVSCTGTANKTFTVSNPNLPSCDNGNTEFSVSSLVYSNGNLSFVFNASNLSVANYYIKQGTNTVKSGFLQNPTSISVSVDSGILSDGNYTFELVGSSCDGTATGSFTVGANVPQSCPNPTGSISANKTSYSVGESATLTASGLGNYTSIQWAKNGALISGQTSPTLTLSNLGLTNNGDKYRLRIENDCGGGKTLSNILSNEIELAVTTTTSTTKRYIIPAKMNTDCLTEVIQIGYSTSQVVPSVWSDCDLTKMLVSNGTVTSEVTSGGVNYQAKAFDLQAGTYYFYARQKTDTTNVVSMGSLVAT
jgi:hypothetical protein